MAPTETNVAENAALAEAASVEEQPPLSVAPVLARRGSGVRCPGKIVIPKCLSTQASPATNSASPKFKDTKKPPLPQTPKSAAAEPPCIVAPEDKGARPASPAAAATEESTAPEKVVHKRVIPVPRRPKSKSPLGASPREREVGFPTAAAEGDKSPSVERKRDAVPVTSRGILRRSASKPQRELSTEEGSKEPDVADNVLQSTAEITLSNRKKAEEEQQKQSSGLWDNAVPGTPEEEIPEQEAPPRRMSPEGSSADEHARLAADSPVRSYKKFTFGKDGTCITESGRVYAQPKSDGSWTTVEKKTKITRRPSNATSVDEEVVRTPGPPPKDELTVPRSASGSSSESTDIFNDMFPDWRTSSPFGNLMRMKSSIKKLNKGSLFRGADPFASMEPFRREQTPERRAREWGRRSGGGQVSTSTDRDSSDEDDFDLHFDSSHPQALFQFMRNMSRDFRNHWKSFLPSSSPFSRSSKEPSSPSSRPQRETLLRFVVDKPSKATGSEPGTPHSRVAGDPFSKRSSGVWDPVDRASLFGTLRRNRLQDLPGRHHADRGTSLDRGAGNSDFWGVHQDPEGTRHRVEKWLHLSNDNADPLQSRGEEGAQQRCQQKYNRSQSDKFNLGEESRPVYQSEISVESNRTAPPGAPCSRSLSVNERGGGRRPLVRMQVSINNRSSNPNAHIVITTPPTTSARTECGLWPQDDSVRRDDGDSPGAADSSLLEALQTRGLRSLLSQRSGSLAREVSPRRGEPPDRPAQSERGGHATAAQIHPRLDGAADERRERAQPGSRSPGEESVQERIHRKSFYPRFHDDPRAAARRRSALWDTEYSGLWSQELRDRDDAALLRKSRSLWDNNHLWDLSFDDVPGDNGIRNYRCNRTESKDYDSLESDGPPS
ncbi:hypothetical protein MRX96_028409 [Rhipicephalus microplus]